MREDSDKLRHEVCEWFITNKDELFDQAMDKIDPLLDDVIPEQDTDEDELGES